VVVVCRYTHWSLESVERMTLEDLNDWAESIQRVSK